MSKLAFNKLGCFIGDVIKVKKLVLLMVLSILLMSGCRFSLNDDKSTQATSNANKILAMADNDMYDALMTRFMDADLNTLNQKQLTVATLINFESEMMCGGLCQFFTNDYPGYAQYVSNALKEIGATEMEAHYTTFITQNGIDVTQMDSFRIMGIFDYLEQYERFPYEAFDNTFSEIYHNENLSDMLLAYVRLYANEILD